MCAYTILEICLKELQSESINLVVINKLIFIRLLLCQVCGTVSVMNTGQNTC